MDAAVVQRSLRAQADPGRARVLSRFFKTGPGHYGEGDRFLGLTVPTVRQVARQARTLPLTAVDRLLRSGYHEERLCALLILVEQFSRARPADQARRYRFYLRHTHCINNWDLVDVSAEKIVGPYLEHRSQAPLFRLARSPSVWERRIAVLATFHYIKRGRFDETLRLAQGLLRDPHDLIHKAVGWMLREIGKRDRPALERFLGRHYRTMPRTMLRYAIERFPARRRRAYLQGRIPLA
jgi:3-methyladenine DNA glycosylase AlkD